MSPEDRARLEAIEHELAAHDRTGSICLHMQACCSIGSGEHVEWLLKFVRECEVDASLAANVAANANHRAEQAEMERNQARGLLTVETALREAFERNLGNLLARIHRDGGHYQAQHGTEKAAADADALVVEMLQAREQLGAAPKLWSCPECAFEFNEQHEDVEGGYSCPLCQLDAAVCVLKALQVTRTDWPAEATINNQPVSCLDACDDTFDADALSAFAKIAHLVKP